MTSPPRATYRFHSPSEVVAGEGASGRVGPLLSSWAIPKGSTVCVVVDPDVEKLGLTAPACSSLDAEGYQAKLLICEPGEPAIVAADRLVSDARRIRPAACVGIGGGSTMDVAKLAAALITNQGEVSDYVGGGGLVRPSVPTVMIPTTAGTGSEATQVAMVSVAGKKAAIASPPLMPRAAILDPTLTVGLPPRVTAAAGLDALSHAFESFLSTNANASTKGASVLGARLVASSIECAFVDGGDVEMRMRMLTGAYWSGVGLNAGVVLGHSIAYTIANRTGLPHGVTCAMALPYCLAYNEAGHQGQTDSLAFELRPAVSDVESWDRSGIYGWLYGLSQRLGIPLALEDVGIVRGDLAEMVAECIGCYPRANNPVPLEKGALARLYDYLFRGDARGYVESVQNL